MRILEHPGLSSPVLHQRAARRVDLHWNLAAIEGPHIAIRRHRHARHRRPFAARRFFMWPVGLYLLSVGVLDPCIGWDVGNLLHQREAPEACVFFFKQKTAYEITV